MKKGTFIAIVITLIVLIFGVLAFGAFMLQKQSTSESHNAKEETEDEDAEDEDDRKQDNDNKDDNDNENDDNDNENEDNNSGDNDSGSKFAVSKQQNAEEEKATEEVNATTEEQPDRYELYKRRSYYAEVISKFANMNLLPGETESSIESSSARDEGNRFAVCDVDGDGREELLISVTSTSMASMREIVYDYDVNTDTLKQQMINFPSVTYYSNGVVKVEASHNQGLGLNLWPYSVYTFDSEEQIYAYTGSVDSWEKEYSATDYSGNAFPDDLDADGDGVLYYISNGEAETKTSTKAELDAWENSVFGKAGAINVPWIDIKDSTAIEIQYQKDFQTYLRDRRETSAGTKGTDIGKLYVDDVDVVSTLENNYGFEFVDENEYYTTGNYNGKQVVNFYWESGGSMEYTGERVGDITLFEIYPGMSRTEADALLKAYGFATNSSEDSYSTGNSYSTGDSFGNWSIYLQYDNGIVTSISLYASCAYVS